MWVCFVKSSSKSSPFWEGFNLNFAGKSQGLDEEPRVVEPLGWDWERK